MKYLLIVGDGMADEYLDELNGKSPVESVAGDAMAVIGGGVKGRIRTCPKELAPGSDVAFLSLLGHDPVKCYKGRSPLEAAGEQVMVHEGEVSMRMNLCTIRGGYEDGIMESYNADDISGDDALAVAGDLVKDPAFAALMKEAQMEITVTDTFRHVAVMKAGEGVFDLTPPHDITGQHIGAYQPKGYKAEIIHKLQQRAYEFLSGHPVNKRREAEGKAPATGIWLWGAGRATVLASFPERYGLQGTAVSAVPLVRGIAWLSGLKAPKIKGADGTLDTNYEGKVAAAMQAFRDGDDFVLLHLEAPDDMSHLGSLEKKLESIRRFNDRMVKPALEGMKEFSDFRILMMPDHYTLLSTKTHDGTPVPYAIYDSRKETAPAVFCERACEGCDILTSGDDLLKIFLEK